MENIVYNELLVRGYNVDVGIVDVFAKNSEGKRVHKQLEVEPGESEILYSGSL